MSRHDLPRRLLLATVFVSQIVQLGWAREPDWREGVRISTPRSNPYELEPDEFKTVRHDGRLLALEYPVEISGSVIPWRPLKKFFDDRSENPIRAILQGVFRELSEIRSSDDFLSRIGLHSFPRTRAEGADDIPRRGDSFPDVRMGTTIFDRDGAEALTFSCAACHSSNLFGKKIIGMTNRFPRANELFIFGKKATSLISPALFKNTLGATEDEVRLYRDLREAIRYVGVKKPAILGLDTSLAQVALSLAHRSLDEYATLDPKLARRPRSERLATFVADSKPAVWWNLRYKNRWLSDGSVVSGNPIYTNLLWNEIGRGTDLRELETWLERNEKAIRDLTTAVFSAEAPLYTDFFIPQRINLPRAQSGGILFEKACARCHGSYRKAWELPGNESLPLLDRLKTVEVRYPEETVVRNVGTDPQRWQGMASLARGLNPLAISKRNGIVIKPQKGYVPPPLVGIWARFPYFHNNSVPNLCALLTRGEERPTSYWSGETLDRERDFDSDCVGYPIGTKTPKEWKERPEHLYVAGKPGLSNRGHDEGIFLKEGKEIFNFEEKRDLIEFLKTL